MTNTDAPTTDRVTLAVVASKLDALTSAQQESSRNMQLLIDRMDARMREVETCQSSSKVEIGNIKEDMSECREKLDRLQTRDTWWSGINTTLAVLAGVLGLNR